MSVLGPLGASAAFFSRKLDDLGKAVGKVEGTILQSAQAMGGSAVVGGLSTLGDAFTLVAANLATALMPAFVELTATVLDLAPTLGTIGEFISREASALVDIFGRLVGAVGYVVEVLGAFKMAIEDTVNWILRKISFGTVGGAAHTPEDYAKREKNARAALGQVFEQGGGESHGKNVESVVKSMQQALGKQGQVGFGGIAEAQRQVQMRAFQTDIQAQILKTNVEQLEVAKRHLVETQKKPGAVGP